MVMASLEMVLQQIHRRKKQLVIVLCVLVAVYIIIAGDMLHNESPNNLPTRGYRKVEIANGSAHKQLISRRKDKDELEPNMNKYHGIDLMSLVRRLHA